MLTPSCVVQVKLWFDSSALQLVVTVSCAAGLTPRPDGAPRNPYAKLFLLPDRGEKSKRRTKTLANTVEPKWNQSFVYSAIRRADLKLRVLEITVWDYVRYGANDFLGEVRRNIRHTFTLTALGVLAGTRPPRFFLQISINYVLISDRKLKIFN